jgi:DNA-binding NarL/FixJ family response regulator
MCSARLLKRRNPKVKVIVTSSAENTWEAMTLARKAALAGADAFLPKDRLIAELLPAIDRLFPGRLRSTNPGFFYGALVCAESI